MLLNDRRFHYLEWPGQSAQAIVFLHGAGLNAYTWRRVAADLCGVYKCLALDLRGHGDSEWANDLDYAPRSHAADLAAFIVHAQLERPVLVGMSLGGTVALAYVREHATRALVIVDTGPWIDGKARAQLLDFFRGPAEFDSLDAFVELARTIHPRRDEADLREGVRNNLRQLPDGTWTWKYDRRPYRHVPDERRDRERREVWSGVANVLCPVLVVRGSESAVLSASAAQDMAASFRDGRLVEIAGAGHGVHSDQPAALSRAILSFLGEAP